MKKHLLLFCILSFATFNLLFAQQTINDTITHDGLQRDYILYVPSSYNANEAIPLVLNLHGYTSNAQEQFLYTNFQGIADAEGFMFVCPNGTFDNSNNRFWNASFGASVDDVGFLSNLIDTLMSQYNIDATKVFSTGMSNGGFMSYKLACELSDRIAKIASVTGSMNVMLENTCNPANLMPIMQIHGTTDPTVAYNGSTGVLGMEELVNYWVAKNNCTTTPVEYAIPDINTTDNSTAVRYTYNNSSTNNKVVFYKITNGGHTWPDGLINLPAAGNTNRDFNATQVIWDFFAGKDTVETGLTQVEEWKGNILQNETNITVESKDKISTLQIVNAIGEVMVQSNTNTISIANLSKGVYFLIIENNGIYFSKSFVK